MGTSTADPSTIMMIMRMVVGRRNRRLNHLPPLILTFLLSSACLLCGKRETASSVCAFASTRPPGARTTTTAAKARRWGQLVVRHEQTGSTTPGAASHNQPPTPRFFMDDGSMVAATGGRMKSMTTTTPSSSSTSRGSTAVHDLIAGDIAWNSLIGEADRAFRHGIQLEKNGQARKAAAYFHEAATLYQCALDRPKEFGHVTSLSFADGRSILAYACLSLAFLNMDVLKNPMAASRLFRLACDNVPTAVSFDGMGIALEAAGASLTDAVKAYRQALEFDPGNAKVRFHLAVALERLGTGSAAATSTTGSAATASIITTTTTTTAMESDGDTGSSYADEADRILDGLRREHIDHACLVDSWGYVRYHTRKVRPYPNLYRGTREMLELAINHATINDDALLCEFGVGSGRSLRLLQEIVELSQQIHGFDTFTGLPQAWGNVPAGTYSTGGIVPNMEGKVVFHKGLFQDTIKPFLAGTKPTAFLSYANIDCRLYTSTVDILEALYARVVPGTIIVFSGYTCHGTWRQDLFRAWRECCKRFGWKYDYLGFSLSTKQAVVRVTHA